MNRIAAYIKNHSLARNVLLNGMMKPVSMLISYLSVPIILHYLGEEKYGAWATILSILSWISYFDIGIGNGLRNKLTDAIARKDTERCRKLVSSAYAMLSVISLTACAVMCTVSLFLNWNALLGLKTQYAEIKPAILLSIVFIALTFVLSLCKNVLLALQKAALTSAIDLCIQLLNLTGVVILSVFTSGSLLLVSIVSGSASVIACLAFSVILYNRHRELCPSLRYSDRATGKEVTSLGIHFFIIQLCGLILFTTDNVIISNLYGAEAVTPYSIVNKLYTAVIGLHAAVLTPFWSAVTKANSEHQPDRIRRIIRYSICIMIPFAAVAVLIACVFRPLTTLWLQQELNCSDLMVWLGAVYCVVYIWCSTFSIFSNGLNVVKGPMYLALAQATVNIPVSLLFAIKFRMQSEGILLGTIFAMLIGAVVIPIFVVNAMKRQTIAQETEKNNYE